MKPNIKHSVVFFFSVAFCCLILVMEHLSGPFIRVPVLFVLPVLALSWFSSPLAGGLSGVIFPFVRLWIGWNVVKPWSNMDSAINTALIVVSLVSVSVIVWFVKRQQEQIKTLQGMLSICSFCKKIRAAEDSWEHLETYIAKHSEADFTHGICPACAEKEYGYKPGVPGQGKDRK
ncbi:MAG: hypothetical protein MUF22_03060 [Chitinispirillaceae bacterium]|jgi:hypothetical protein|nr:hypothetical protein [Chitinispirillaceae bacterium]